MWQQRSDLDEPDDNTVLWRYFPINWFLTLIETKQLYFCRADLFYDQLEGLTPFGTVKAIEDELPSDASTAVLCLRNLSRGKMFVSCWHENLNENPVMWKQYAQNSSGIAIKTTAKRIRNCLVCAENIVIGRVKYIDFSSHPRINDVHEQHLLKDNSYSFEREVRLLYFTGMAGGLLSEVGKSDPREGISLEIDIFQLIGEIVLGSTMLQADVERVKAALSKIKLSVEFIRESAI